MLRILRLAAIAAVVYVMIPCAFGAVFTFTGDGDGVSWHDPDNWDADAVPAETADGEAAADVVVDGAFDVIVGIDVTAVHSLTLQGTPGDEPNVTVAAGVTLKLQGLDIARGGLILGDAATDATVWWSKSNRGSLICRADGYIAGRGLIFTLASTLGGVQLLSQRSDAHDMTEITLQMKYHETLRVGAADLGRTDANLWEPGSGCIGTIMFERTSGDYELLQADGTVGNGTNALYCRRLQFTGNESRVNLNGLNVYVRDEVRWYDGTTLSTPGFVGTGAAFDPADPTTSLYDTQPARGQVWLGMSPPASVVGRHVFYADSAFAATGDDDAIATDKAVLLGGAAATFANYTSYVRGLNGIMVDIANPGAAVTVHDFQFMVGNDNDLSTWTEAPAPTSVTVRPGEGVDASDRAVIVWADGAIATQWLAVIVKSNSATGLSAPDVSYIGNAIGETGDSVVDAIVDAADIAAVAANHTSVPDITSPYDHNRDGEVDATDEAIAAGNTTDAATALILLNAPATPQFNMAPTVIAGADQTIVLPYAALLNGSVSDDGLPVPANVTVAWSLDTGPAAVQFSPVDDVATTATFTELGTYVLLLTAYDGAMTGSDTVTVTVEAAPEPNTYYVDQNHPSASDASEGSETNPWLTVAHAITQVAHGDTIYVKEGIYRESIALAVSGLPGRPISLIGYPGHRVVLAGSDEVTGWAACTESIAKGNANFASMVYADIGFRPGALYQDGVPVDYGRSPDAGWWNVEGDSTTATELTDTAHLTQPDGYWAGGHLFIWRLSATQQYIRDITDSTASGTLTFDALKYVPADGDRYFIRNKVESISADGQWAYEDIGGGAWRVYLWSRGDADPAACLIEATVPGAGFMIDFHKQGWWVIDNLEIRHGSGHGLGTWSEPAIGHITVQNCSIHHNGSTGIYGGTSPYAAIRRNYIAYNGGIDDNGVGTGPEGAVIEDNEIAHNGKDGLRIGGGDHVIRRNYIHGHWFWQHADNVQTDGGATNVLLEENFILNGGQNYMMDGVNGITFSGNVIGGSRGNMLIFGHDSCSDATLINNTLCYPGNSIMDTSGGVGYYLRDNLVYTAKLGGAWGASDAMGYESDYNLFYFAPGLADTDWRLITWTAGGVTNWGIRGLLEYQQQSGQDLNSLYADPMFANAPARYVGSDGSRLTELTPTRTYIDPVDAPLFVVGECIELDWDGVVRTITAVGADYVEFTPAEPRLQLKAPAMGLWGTNDDFTLDLTVQAGSPAAGMASDGGTVGSPIDTVAFAMGDFDGDGQRDIPIWPEDPSLATAVPGDADGDGDVDLDDFVILKQNFGAASGATQATGDFDGDGNVDLDDFVILKQNFGTAR